jgi:hypothetical protein
MIEAVAAVMAKTVTAVMAKTVTVAAVIMAAEGRQ